MLDENEALRLAEAKLAGIPVNGSLVVTGSQEFAHGWVFFWDAARYLETGDLRDRLGGNAPILVDRRDGSVHLTGTARPLDDYIDSYVRDHP